MVSKLFCWKTFDSIVRRYLYSLLRHQMHIILSLPLPLRCCGDCCCCKRHPYTARAIVLCPCPCVGECVNDKCHLWRHINKECHHTHYTYDVRYHSSPRQRTTETRTDEKWKKSYRFFSSFFSIFSFRKTRVHRQPSQLCTTTNRRRAYTYDSYAYVPLAKQQSQ